VQPEALIQTLVALMDAESEVADNFLMAAIYCRALREERSPRDIADALWKALPSAQGWPGLRIALEAVMAESG
jgi:hypothetical protein